VVLSSMHWTNAPARTTPSPCNGCNTLTYWSHLHPSIKLVVTGRDERIPPSFVNVCDHIVVKTGDLVSSEENDDIKTFMERRFADDIAPRYPSLRSTWPGHSISFTEFVCDPVRCRETLVIPRSTHSGLMALACLENMNKGLKFNICRLERSYRRVGGPNWTKFTSTAIVVIWGAGRLGGLPYVKGKGGWLVLGEHTGKLWQFFHSFFLRFCYRTSCPHSSRNVYQPPRASARCIPSPAPAIRSPRRRSCSILGPCLAFIRQWQPTRFVCPLRNFCQPSRTSL
jgi:hypothetical protein